MSEELNKDNDGTFEGVPYEQKARAKKMMMALIIFAIVMLFAGLTSAYIVSNGPNFWVHVNPPSMLWISNIIILISSVTIIMALRKIKSGAQKAGGTLILVTFLLGIAFSFTQVRAWKEMSSKGMGWTTSYNDHGQKQYRWNFIGEIEGEYGVDYVVYKDRQTLELEDGEFYFPSDKERTNPVTNKVNQISNSSSSYIWILIMIHIAHLVLGLCYLLVLYFRTQKGQLNKDNSVSLYTGGMYWHFLGILWLYLFVFLFYIH